MKLCVLASGSLGNSFFVASGKTKILVDCGITRNRILDKLGIINEHPRNIDGVFVSHEHGDHVAGLGPFINSWWTPVFCSAGTETALRLNQTTPPITAFETYEPFEVGDLEITPIPVDHDAINPVAYRVTAKSEARTVVIATDLGQVSPALERAFDLADFAFIEANHDPDMLLAGPYRVEEKVRIMKTHLCNTAAFDLITASNCPNFIIGHISSTNNNFELLQQMTRRAPEKHIAIAYPGTQTQVFTF